MTTRIGDGRSRLSELEARCALKDQENQSLRRQLEEAERGLADARIAVEELTRALRHKGCCEPPSLSSG